ncbi:MAG: TM2 domain-containing protein [Planctomycetaceae bacterium]|nr:TM2 domain-containing protein [Planctomycetaceae bacterium]
MYCTNCGKDGVHENAIACIGCGVSPRMEKNYCYHCGEKLNSPNQMICVKCGHGVQSVKYRAAAGEKSRITAALLAIFLGGIGVHKFYLGSWGWGIVYIAVVAVTLGFGAIATGIAALVEFIIYLTMDDAQFAEKYSQETQSPFRW